jgi:hypothetical protein
MMCFLDSRLRVVTELVREWNRMLEFASSTELQLATSV